MAKITYFDALGDGNIVTSFYDEATLEIKTWSPTAANMIDDAGARIRLTGTNLDFDGQAPTGGIITGLDLFDSSGHLLTRVTQASIDAVEMFNDFQSLGLFGVLLSVIASDDRIYGSSHGDLILGNLGNDKVYAGQGNDLIDGGEQNDLIFGGDGNDVCYGGKGRDTITGDGGADSFFYLRKYGRDTITDFTDTGPVETRDHIELSRALYRKMVATQTPDGHDVDLSFGGSDHIILKNFDLADLGRSDFIFS